MESGDSRLGLVVADRSPHSPTPVPVLTASGAAGAEAISWQPDPPFDIETFEPIDPPWQAIREWIPDDDAEPSFDLFDQRPDSGKAVEILREDGNILVLDGD